MGKDFFLCATNNWKTTEVGIPYRMSGPFSIYLHLLLAQVVRVPTVRIVGTVTNLSHPYQEILIVSSARMQLSDQTRRDGHLATDQTPPRGQQPCKNPWAAERAAYTVMGYCTTLSPAPDVFMHLGLRACCAPFLPVGGRCPAHRSASLASDAYVTRAIPAREATKPQGSTRHRTGSGGTGSPHFLLDVTSSPSRHESYYTHN
ncbi:hypothetical protein V8C43DRAFT_286396 [Trichoderma afarasin]